MRGVLFAIVIFFSGIQVSYAKNDVTWMILDWPPWMILEGEHKGAGEFDYILAEVFENLPQYNHITEKMNWARFWHKVKNGNNICYVFGLKTGNREDIAYFSAPHTLILPNAIIMRKTDAEKLGNPETYSLAKLLSDERFKGMVEKSRSFTEVVDNVLKTYEPGSNLSRAGAQPESLVKMVASGRINYTIEYPTVASYHAKKLGDKAGVITSIPIAEMELFTYAYMSCTKNEWGKEIIESWNEVLGKIKPTEKYRRITEAGYTDARELKIIRQNYDAFIEAE